MPFPWSWVRSPQADRHAGSVKLGRASQSLCDVTGDADPKEFLRKETNAFRRRQKAQSDSDGSGPRDSCDDREGRRPDGPTCSPSGRWLPVRSSWKSVRAALTGSDTLMLGEVEKIIQPDSQFADKYETRKVIGLGAFSQVSLVTRVGGTEEFACKTLFMSPSKDEPKTIEMSSMEQVRNEVSVLQKMDHPNVAKLVDVFIGPEVCRLVMPLQRGGDLLEALRFRGSFPEEDARTIMSSILSALKHIHSLGIAHRDLKLENLLLNEPHDLSQVVLIDFGLAKAMRDDPFGSACGTPMYVAPEVVTDVDKRTGLSRYGCEVDVWSAGIVLFMLLSGSPPFTANSVWALLRKVRSGRVFVDDPVWQLVSDEAKDLLCGLLTMDPKRRITVDAALAHPWFSL